MKNHRSVIKFISLCLLIPCLFIFLTGCESKDYKKAMELYQFGQYDQAILMFEALGEYEDSLEMIKACNYEIAESYYDQSKYEEALSYYEKAGDYKDSASLIKDAKSHLGLELFNEGKTAEAIQFAVEAYDSELGNKLLHKIMFELINEQYIPDLTQASKHMENCIETMSNEIYRKLFSGQSVMLTVSSLIKSTDTDVVALSELRGSMRVFYSEYCDYFTDEVLAVCDEDMLNVNEQFKEIYDYANRLLDTYGQNGFGQYFINTISSKSSKYSPEDFVVLVAKFEKAMNAL